MHCSRVKISALCNWFFKIRFCYIISGNSDWLPRMSCRKRNTGPHAITRHRKIKKQEQHGICTKKFRSRKMRRRQTQYTLFVGISNLARTRLNSTFLHPPENGAYSSIFRCNAPTESLPAWESVTKRKTGYCPISVPGLIFYFCL